MALNKIKRRVASGTLIQLFFMQEAVTYTLSRITAPGPHSDALGAGLSAKETEFIRDMTLRLHKDAELMRKLGHRLRKEI